MWYPVRPAHRVDVTLHREIHCGPIFAVDFSRTPWRRPQLRPWPSVPRLSPRLLRRCALCTPGGRSGQSARPPRCTQQGSCRWRRVRAKSLQALFRRGVWGAVEHRIHGATGARDRDAGDFKCAARLRGAAVKRRKGQRRKRRKRRKPGVIRHWTTPCSPKGSPGRGPPWCAGMPRLPG